MGQAGGGFSASHVDACAYARSICKWNDRTVASSLHLFHLLVSCEASRAGSAGEMTQYVTRHVLGGVGIYAPHPRRAGLACGRVLFKEIPEKFQGYAGDVLASWRVFRTRFHRFLGQGCLFCGGSMHPFGRRRATKILKIVVSLLALRSITAAHHAHVDSG